MGIHRRPRRHVDRTLLKTCTHNIRKRKVAPIDPRELIATKAMQILKLLRIRRMPFLIGSIHPFTDYFKGFEKTDAIRQIFGERTEAVLQNLKVEITTLGGYMWVSDVDGHLVVSAQYLNSGDKVDIYLDIIHELVHVRQFIEGKGLFDTRYDYADRPTEIEAYNHAVKEARRIGLSDTRICQYLKTEWMNERELKQLAKTLNVKC